MTSAVDENFSPLVHKYSGGRSALLDKDRSSNCPAKRVKHRAHLPRMIFFRLALLVVFREPAQDWGPGLRPPRTSARPISLIENFSLQTKGFFFSEKLNFDFTRVRRILWLAILRLPLALPHTFPLSESEAGTAAMKPSDAASSGFFRLTERSLLQLRIVAYSPVCLSQGKLGHHIPYLILVNIKVPSKCVAPAPPRQTRQINGVL